MIFVKYFPRKIKRKRASDRFCPSYRTKYQNGEIYPTIGRCGICFLRVRRFSGAAFFHTRAYVHVGICAPAHTCVTHAHLLVGARRTEFQRSAFYDSFAELFHPASSQKAKLRNFRGGQCRSLQNPVKNVKFGLKRLRNGFLRR